MKINDKKKKKFNLTKIFIKIEEKKKDTSALNNVALLTDLFRGFQLE